MFFNLRKLFRSLCTMARLLSLASANMKFFNPKVRLNTEKKKANYVEMAFISH